MAKMLMKNVVWCDFVVQADPEGDCDKRLAKWDRKNGWCI